MILAGCDLVRSDPGEIQLDTTCSFVQKTQAHTFAHTNAYTRIKGGPFEQKLYNLTNTYTDRYNTKAPFFFFYFLTEEFVSHGECDTDDRLTPHAVTL